MLSKKRIIAKTARSCYILMQLITLFIHDDCDAHLSSSR
ncbi:hypothetical protein EBME_0759 [bacterium endosymbiont of Mortierella elongata FMR23-6]|nr:hypothetical protein EBME_0759 [bacterium endosymbiont of Mortierella elongata FMR23-6]